MSIVANDANHFQIMLGVEYWTFLDPSSALTKKQCAAGIEELKIRLVQPVFHFY